MAEKQKRSRSDSWGSIRQLPSGRYQARYTGPDGLSYTAKTDAGAGMTFGTKTDARTWLRKTHQSIVDGTWESPEARLERIEKERKQSIAHRFEAYAMTWIDQRRNGKGEPLRPATRVEYERQIQRGLAVFAEDGIEEITPARVRAWHAERSKVGATAAGAEARLLRAIMNTAVVDEIIAKNPVPASLTRTQTGLVHRPPTVDELLALLDAIADRFKFAIVLAAYGGLRLSEWRALRRADLRREEFVRVVDGEAQVGVRYVVNVWRQAQHIKGEWVVGDPKSAEGKREVPLSSVATPAVDAHLEQFVGRGPESLLFPARRGGGFMPDMDWNRHWNLAREAVGLRVKVDGKWVSEVREHDFRAFAGTMHQQGGATLRETMAFLGHSTTVAAMAYQKTMGRESELAERMPVPALPRG